MCGICGTVSPGGVKAPEIQAMMETIAHRGPDDDGLYVNGSVGLGARRLSIIDLALGHQPISNEDGTIWIVFNGEIYNYKQLRSGLEAKGHSFQTQSDTEVIVHLYEDLGEKCVTQLRGMFAFAIWDARNDKLFLARDHLGQKPLFYCQLGDRFLFASEVKAILSAGDVPREVDFDSIHHYLSLRFIPSPGTMFRHIKKLPPAHYLVYQESSIRLEQYWQLSFQEKLSLSEQDYMEGLRTRLASSVESHLVSDVPVGAFLSGGMDSSMIVAMMARSMPETFQTFAVGVAEQDFNELPYARQVADHVHTCHVEACVEADLVGSLPRMVWHLDEPSDPIAACMFQAADLASRHVKVVLGGDGGDELFAGFDRYLGIRYIDYYAMIPSKLRRRLFGPLVNRVPDSFTYKSTTQKLRWIQQLSMKQGAGERYAEATSFFRFSHQDKKALFGSDLWGSVRSLDSAQVIASHYENADAVDALDRMLYADYMTRLPEHSLMLTDRMTMAHGLEARSPYLDHELVTYLAALPSRMKIRDRKLKYALREVAKDYLPERIIDRGKQGFMFPVAYWFQTRFYSFIRDYLLDSYFVRDGLFRRDSVLRLVEDHRNRRVDNHVRLWMLMNLEIWHQIYIEQNEHGHVRDRLLGYL
ncbi:MAG: asparagine synthase (glutamine-hydrolyzing) [Chloroflexota bacterium]|nr:MAG: asparagine synthase (glutamine-hydrolyzing) [Chloroflexota bacterium]